jgi:cyclic beta-1,2-glucan synthetase
LPRRWILASNGLNLRHAFGRIRRGFGPNNRVWSEPHEQPFRLALFNVAQLEQHAISLAASHTTSTQRRHRAEREKLLRRLAANKAVLADAHALMVQAVRRERRITPAAEWLLDNYHLIEDQIRTARHHLPRGYNRELPRLESGPSAGLPRVYDIALELTAHVDGRIDALSLRAFIVAYQSASPLQLGELWAIPIMARLALLENLRRVVVRIAAGRRARERAGYWIERMLAVAATEPARVVVVLAEMIQENPPLTTPFIAEFAGRLRGEGANLVFPLTWLEQRMIERGETLEQIFQQASQEQAADQVSIGNSINSLRFVEGTDWKTFVESMSVVEKALTQDPSGIYAGMDFSTRDRYRHAVEKLARRSRCSETFVAETAVQRASQHFTTPRLDEPQLAQAQGHVGYFLIDRGRRALERDVGARRTLPEQLARFHRRFAIQCHLGAIAILAGVLTAGVLQVLARSGAGRPALVAVIALTLICASQVAVALVHWLTMLILPPRSLPRMDFLAGIPPEHRTLVAVPTMLNDPREIDEMLEAMEVRFLANRDANLAFALLTDFCDAPNETMPDDDRILNRAQIGIQALNAKYSGEQPDIASEGLDPPGNDTDDAATVESSHGGSFILLHRRRRWNPSQGTWMGWERKRGKLEDLNATLRGAIDRFNVIVGPTSLLKNVKYVITLDSDTQLPRDAARQLVGTMAHPLNRPRYDPQSGRVVEGYSILQPRVAISLPSARKSHFARLFVADPGIDPYTHAVSDIYQDVFEEGSYIGKGIYDVSAFVESTGGRLPPNRILSHDLLEGAHARAALVSDILLFEDYPSSYAGDVSRRHRWIRGDWQITSWLLPRVPDAHGRSASNPLSALSRWKILDNLRRSLVAPALLALLIYGWTLNGCEAFLTLIVLAILLLPMILTSFAELTRRPSELSRFHHVRLAMFSICRQLFQALFTLACLPFDAWLSLDAIGRTGVRLWFTRRRLLEWQTAREAQHRSRSDIVGFFAMMWVSPVTAIVVTALIRHFDVNFAPIAIPIVSLWVLSPGIAWWLSQPIRHVSPHLSFDDRLFLRKLARRTWRFFEDFVVESENHLPPDNYQEDPLKGPAHRTSPTNIGLALLANLGAYDFGYITLVDLIQRTSRTLDTLDRVQRYRGHFYNWYDTRTLEPLRPLYISTVDSGNLAGHLLTLAAGFTDVAAQPIIGHGLCDGLRDTLEVAIEHAPVTDKAPRTSSTNQPPAAFLARVSQLRDALGAVPTQLSVAHEKLQRLLVEATVLSNIADAGESAELKTWTSAIRALCQRQIDLIARFAPWVQRPIPRWAHADAGAAPSKLRDALHQLDSAPSLADIARLERTVVPFIDFALTPTSQVDGNASPSDPHVDGLVQLRADLVHAAECASQCIADMNRLAVRCRELADLDYEFLYDKDRHLLAIGYDVSQHRLDGGRYDLLASECRFGSFVGIAQGKLPQEHWFRLGRQFTTSGGKPALLSWSGSMFEYLMPLLVMPTYEHTLLDETYRAVVKRQISYGRLHSIPWGISESGYFKVDAQLNYQYRAFGVPGLGFKPDLADELVIAPYATAMALMVDPRAAAANLRRLAAEGRMGPYGLYEAVDYTVSRLPRDQTSITIRSFMAHHQVMTLLSLAYVLLDQPMQRRFQSDPGFRATELLLQERVPKVGAVFPYHGDMAETNRAKFQVAANLRVFDTPHTPLPEVHLLSNGRYHVAVTNAGGGYSRWRDLAVSRWREDSVRDCWGSFCYLRDVDTGEFWSATHQPTLKRATSYEVIYAQGRAEFHRQDGLIDTRLDVSVSPEDDIELRRISLTNRGRTRRTIEITSYAEVVLAPLAADAAHPAFSNLFVQTEFVPTHRAILATRRARDAAEKPPWMLHLMTANGKTVGESSFETARDQFIGRSRSLVDPAAMYASVLSNSQGAVLDPIVSIRITVVIEPDQSTSINLVTGVAETREGAAALIEKYHDHHISDRVFELAWTHSQVVLRQLDASEADSQIFGRLASSIIFSNPLMRVSASVIARNRRGHSGLWGYGISGDLPVVLLRIGDQSQIHLVREVVIAHEYWRVKGLIVDLIIWNEDLSGYRQALNEQILNAIGARAEMSILDKPGGIFVRNIDHISDEDKILMQTVARVIITDTAGTLSEQAMRRAPQKLPMPRLPRSRSPRIESLPAGPIPRKDLVAFNGLGGFTPDGREYVIATSSQSPTPAPWVNVLANPSFGTVITESGGAYTWYDNSNRLRLTPWQNDWVQGDGGEIFYLRDEDTGRFCSLTPHPAPGTQPYTTRHGFGYSIFEYSEEGLAAESTTYVSIDAPVKFFVVNLRNNSGRSRKLSVTAYLELVLGEQRPANAPYIVTEADPRTGALLARNSYNSESGDSVMFFDCSETQRSVTGDRVEFIGRNGAPEAPACMTRARLSGQFGSGLDPCLAMQVPLDLANGSEYQLVFIIGCGRDLAEARSLLANHRGTQAARSQLERVWEYWNRTLGAVHVQTPAPYIDYLANGWLLYQVLACRFWARSGFYQSGGAFGFRDQLQDAMALIHCEPALLRAHLLRCAARQFIEGDVQHWWHARTGRGVRTHISDDYLWLPYATCRYVATVGDTGVLNENVQFLEGRPVKPEEESYYDLPLRSDQSASLYEHCVRAIKNGLKFGEHGLPLMGSGDWNDGMNRVGILGKGESIWLAFFFHDVLQQFAPLAAARNDTAFAELCTAQATLLQQNLASHGWDGQWYRRAYFDNGMPLGSATNDECVIDSLPQSWAVLSNTGPDSRARQALNQLEARLVRHELGLIQLLDPPFDRSSLDPGYIKGYPSGVRENGGQYTHAAIWAIMAFARTGDAQRAWELVDLLNPIHHGDSIERIARYKVEPYVLAGDVYTHPQHVGRGGWTWYTGAAGWMYRLIMEELLGLHLQRDRLRIEPLLPQAWPGFTIHYRYRQTVYHIEVKRADVPDGKSHLLLDGVEQPDNTIQLTDDHKEHAVSLELVKHQPAAPQSNSDVDGSQRTEVVETAELKT